MFLETLFALGWYLIASVPIVYIIGRWRGVDLRREGTRNVGAGNLWQTTGAFEGILGGVADLLKGIIPLLLARYLGFDTFGLTLAVIGCMAGQMWPVFLGFAGGRGNGVAFGLGLVLAPAEIFLSIIPMILGGLPWLVQRVQRISDEKRKRFRFATAHTRIVPVSMLSGFVLLPLLALALREPAPIVIALTAIPALIIFRRITAGLPDDLRQPGSKFAILMNRLLLDRREW